VIVTVGAVVSGGVYVTAIVSVPVLPAASRAVTVMTLTPLCRATLPLVQAVVPDAVPLPPCSLTQVTCTTPTLSLAKPLKPTVLVLVE
jgi:hypothetical protein